MLGWPGGRIEAWRSLGTSAKVRGETARLLGLLWRRGQAGTALVVASHDTAEQIAGPVSYRGRRWLRRAMVLRILARATAGLEFALQAGDFLLVSREDCEQTSCGGGLRHLLCLDLDVLLLQGVHLASDHLNLLDMTSDWGSTRSAYMQSLEDAALRVCFALGQLASRCAASYGCEVHI